MRAPASSDPCEPGDRRTGPVLRDGFTSAHAAEVGAASEEIQQYLKGVRTSSWPISAL